MAEITKKITPAVFQFLSEFITNPILHHAPYPDAEFPNNRGTYNNNSLRIVIDSSDADEEDPAIPRKGWYSNPVATCGRDRSKLAPRG